MQDSQGLNWSELRIALGHVMDLGAREPGP
jgi:hypothetical protein